jgi:hypothetical protein
VGEPVRRTMESIRVHADEMQTSQFAQSVFANAGARRP